jgi:hypothetical protein
MPSPTARCAKRCARCVPHARHRAGWRLTGLGLAFALAVAATAAAGQGAGGLPFYTNEAHLEDLQRRSGLDIADPLAVFAAVLASLPARVSVYPTENYYYFAFLHNGAPYQGNIRLDPLTRDAGKVNFAYAKAGTPWKDRDDALRFVQLDGSHGVSVERLERLLYRVSLKGTSVTFALNDLSGVVPPPAVLATGEVYLGPIFDESGLRFFLVYGAALKAFHYVLDETVAVADEFYSSARTNFIVIGRRTGFAFYRDQRLARKILIGVFEDNSRANTWLDGPFDQLPENFIEGEALREAIVASDPAAKGRIDRLGNYLDGSGRYLIHPYMLYRSEGDLSRIHECAIARESRPDYRRCFVVGSDGQIDPPPRQAKKR